MNSVYETRLRKFNEFLQAEKLGVAMITSPVHVYYLTGFYSEPYERFMALVIDAEHGWQKLFLPALDVDTAAEKSFVKSLIAVTDTDDPLALLKEHLGERTGKFGMEKRSVHVARFEQLMETFPRIQWSDVEHFLVEQRLHKSPEDLLFVRQAAAITDQVLEEVIPCLQVGMTELDITAELEYRMRRLGGDKPSFETIVLTGKRSALPHGTPSLAKTAAGDLLLIDMGVYFGGFCSDITRTFIFGEASEQQRIMYDTVKAANEHAIEAVRQGEPIGVVDQAARKVIEAAGFGAYFTHRTGHGLGFEIHESPSIHGENKLAIQPGLLFTIEPGIYIPEIGGVRIEDDIYVNEEGKAEVLTHYSKRFQMI